ncbi:MAG: hypothetical protein WBR13_08420 [Allosphingosinicella sp.]
MTGCSGDNASNTTARGAAAAAGNAATPANVASRVEQGAHGEETATPRLLLTAEGIEPGGTEAAKIAFGTDGRGAITRVGALLGAHDSETSTECGAGPMEFASFDQMVLMLQQGKLVGWELRQFSEQPWIGTPGGVTIGTPRSELQAALGAAPAVERSSLGVEFSAGGFHGVLSADGPDATVTALWAGTNCVMR